MACRSVQEPAKSVQAPVRGGVVLVLRLRLLLLLVHRSELELAEGERLLDQLLLCGLDDLKLAVLGDFLLQG